LIVDGECGLVVPVGDVDALAAAIERMYADQSMRKQMGQAGRERIGTRFRNEDTVEETLALYREVLAEI
jgi:glycosyltransferase involved in cell wall biosynthesis